MRLLGQMDRRRFLDQLLVSALHRAVALAEVDPVAVWVADELDLGVARRLEVALDVDGAVLEDGLCRRARRLVEGRELLGALDDAHAAPASSGDGLDDHGIADLAGDVVRLVECVDRLDGARKKWEAGGRHQLARGRLVPDLLHHVRLRADERDPLVLADLREIGILGEEAVARMDGVGARLERSADDARDVQVAAADRRRPDLHGLVRELDHGRLGVCGREHGYGLDAELSAGARDTERDLAAVRDQDLLEQGRPYSSTGSRYISTCSNSTHWPSSTRIWLTFPPSSACTWFISFIASTIATVCPASTTSPSSTNGGEPG